MSSIDNMIDRVVSNPSKSYRIYKYLQTDNAKLYKDPRRYPHSLDYIVGVSPKLQKRVETIDQQGSLVYIEWWAYSDDGQTPIEEVLRVNISYTYASDASTNTARTVLSRIVDRQWILEDGNYRSWTETQIANGESDVKRRVKLYSTYRESKRVGKLRRENVAANGEEGFITLVTLLITGGDQQAAEDLGKSILRRYDSDYQTFLDNGDPSFQIDVMTDAFTEMLTDSSGQVITTATIPSGISSQALLNTAIPNTVNLGQGPIPFNFIVPGSEGIKINEWLRNKYNGDIS